jgi:hypothetical protein
VTAPDEMPRATLAEDERERLRGLGQGEYVRVAESILNERLAAARAAGVAQGRAEAAAAIRAEINDEGMRNASHFDYGLDEAARIAEGAEQT